MRKTWVWALTALAGCFALVGPAAPAAAAGKGLDVYFIDVEGGAATLIVTPGGESVLIDSGWQRDDDRDAKRIHEVATRAAGLSRIDHYVTTHWHRDHFGGIGRLAELMPVRAFYHHGIPEQLSEDKQHFPVLMAAYQKASQGKSAVLRPGDDLPLTTAKGAPAPLRLRCVAAHGQTLPEKPAAPANPVCGDHQPKPADTTDNARSVAVLLTYRPFKFFDGGDLTWNVEKDLVCPSNKVGAVDVYQVDHHGMDTSNNPVLLRSLNPRLAVINNGPRKGGAATTYGWLKALPDMQAVYAVHRNVQTAEGDNPPRGFVANWDEACSGDYVKLSVEPDGKHYTVQAGAKGPARRYTTR